MILKIKVYLRISILNDWNLFKLVENDPLRLRIKIINQ